jgi:sulfide:quinone oxidoreductase
MSGRTLILGGGFGGLAAGVELRRLLGLEHEIVLVDREPAFAMGLRKLWELVGHADIADGSRERRLLEQHGVEFVHAEISSIDAAGRSVETSAGTLSADHLVVALGAVSRPDLVDGLLEHGHDVWTFAGVSKARRALAAFDGGRIAVLVAGAPYPCPPAPYECALHLDEHLRRRGLHARTELSVTTLQPILMPNAGKAGSDWMADQLAACGISCRVGAKTERVEAGRVVFDDGSEQPFDLLIAVPPHRAPEVAAASGLIGPQGWIAVDPGTLATDFGDVYAIGDVTTIPLANGLQLPKAGVMAERQGLRVAQAIAAELMGSEPPGPFDGTGYCPVELGVHAGARVDGNWYATPEPIVAIAGPGTAYAGEKAEFERARLTRWFDEVAAQRSATAVPPDRKSATAAQQ